MVEIKKDKVLAALAPRQYSGMYTTKRLNVMEKDFRRTHLDKLLRKASWRRYHFY